MKIGTYYYPEQWPRDQWTRDFDNIAKMGLQIVHMAEFAWFTMEPTPGDIQLDWLGDCLMLAAERKLDVILCTPTAAPPIWLARDFPETLPIENGVVKDFGARRHYSPTSPAYRDATCRIVTALADRFGDHPSIIGWQIDNEYGQPYSTNDHTHSAFQLWLVRKYKSIEALNAAWGCQFWNTYYTAFDQIRMPATRDHNYYNPASSPGCGAVLVMGTGGFQQAAVRHPSAEDRRPIPYDQLHAVRDRRESVRFQRRSHALFVGHVPRFRLGEKSDGRDLPHCRSQRHLTHAR